MSDGNQKPHAQGNSAVPCKDCGHPIGRHWPLWMSRTKCEVQGCPCEEFAR